MSLGFVTGKCWKVLNEGMVSFGLFFKILK